MACEIPQSPPTPGTPSAPVPVVRLQNTTTTGFTLTPISSSSCQLTQYSIPPSDNNAVTCSKILTTSCQAFQVLPATGSSIASPQTSSVAPVPAIAIPDPSQGGAGAGGGMGGPVQQQPGQTIGGPPSSDSSSSSKSSVGVIVGATVGGVAVVAAALAFLLIYRRKSRQRRGIVNGGSGTKQKFDEGEEEKISREERDGRGSRSRSDDVLIHSQDRSLGYNDGHNSHSGNGSDAAQQSYQLRSTSPAYPQTYNNNYNNASLPPPLPSQGLQVPLSSSSALTSATTVQSTPTVFSRAVSPPPPNKIDYQPRSTYQPTVPISSANHNNINKNNQYHSHTHGTTATGSPTNPSRSSSSYSTPTTGELQRSGGQGDYIDLIPVEDTPQIAHAVLPSLLSSSDGKGKGKARALDNEEEEEETGWAEQRGLLTLGSGGGGGSGGRPLQQQQLQGRGKSGKLTSVLDEDEEEIDEGEIKYL